MIDVMTEYLRKTRETADPPDLALRPDLMRPDLMHVSVLELYRAAEAIDSGQRVVEEATEEIARIRYGIGSQWWPLW